MTIPAPFPLLELTITPIEVEGEGEVFRQRLRQAERPQATDPSLKRAV